MSIDPHGEIEAVSLTGRLRRTTVTTCLFVLMLPLAFVLQSVPRSPAGTWTVLTTLVAFCTLAIVRPPAALLSMIALLGFGIILSYLAGVPQLRVSEVLVVSAVAGCLVRALPNGAHLRRALTDTISVPVVLFAMAIVASTLVWVRVDQFETGSTSVYVRALLHALGRDYFVRTGDFGVVVGMAVMLEGLALYVVVAAVCRAEPAFFDRALRMLAVGGAGLAAMSIVRLAEIHLRDPGAISRLRAAAALRISPQIPDYIAAGSYFALCWLAALGLATGSARRLWWVAAGMPLVAAMYLTGSRSVIGAALGGLLILVFAMARQRAAVARGVVASAAIAVVAMVGTYSWMTGRDLTGVTARQSMTARTELARTAVRVIATRPLFGVGIDRFHILAGALSSPKLEALYPGRKNPHNDFLGLGAEMGLVGLGLFLWILVAAGTRTWQALHRTRDARLAGLAGGLVAFLITSVVSDPLFMVPVVSYFFWIALGLAVGYPAALRQPRESSRAADEPPERRSLLSRSWRLVPPILGVLIVVSIPFRARQEIANLDLRRVTYGLSEWRSDDGMKWRWSGPTATLFVDPRARLVEIPVRGTLPAGAPQQVEVRVDGRLANRIAVGREWQRVRTLVPENSSSRPRRIDLLISPTWVPSEVLPRNKDDRVLGVLVGELKVVMAPGQ